MKTLTLIIMALLATTAAAKDTHSIESLERERASMVSAIVDDRFDPQTRSLQIKGYFRRLTDIERMVLRDDRVTSSTSSLAQNAFNKYELTFLVHSSAEKSLPPLSHWMSEVHLTTDSILSAKTGHR